MTRAVATQTASPSDQPLSYLELRRSLEQVYDVDSNALSALCHKLLNSAQGQPVLPLFLGHYKLNDKYAHDFGRALHSVGANFTEEPATTDYFLDVYKSMIIVHEKVIVKDHITRGLRKILTEGESNPRSEYYATRHAATYDWIVVRQRTTGLSGLPVNVRKVLHKKYIKELAKLHTQN